MRTMFCVNCGKVLSETAKFCPDCGAPVAAAPVPEQPPIPVVAPAIEDAPVAAAPVVEETPVEEAPVEEVPAEEVPAEEALAEEAPAVEAPAVEAPAEEVPVEAVPVEAAPVVEEAPVKKPKGKPPVGVRILLQVCSFLLTLVLFATALVTTVFVDLRLTTNSQSVRKFVTGIFNPAPVTAHGYYRIPAGKAIPGGKLANPNVIRRENDGPDFEFSEDALENMMGDALGDTALIESLLTAESLEGTREIMVDWVHGMMNELYPQEDGDTIEKERVRSFLDKSELTGYLADKVASYADDLVNGTAGTIITTEEIVQLIDENRELMEWEFNMEISDDVREEMVQAVTKLVEEDDLNDRIQVGVIQEVRDTSLAGDTKVEDILSLMRTLRSNTVLAVCAVVCLALIGLLLLCNYYDIPGGLGWAGTAFLIPGILLSIPVAIFQLAPNLPAQLAPGVIVEILGKFITMLAPAHYGCLGIGILLLIASLIVRIVRNNKAKKAQTATV